MYRLRMGFAIGLVTLIVGGVASEQPHGSSGVIVGVIEDRVVAPVVYKDLMLVIASADGVAAVVFTDKLKKGRGYKFRFESKDGKMKKSGKGKVFEKYKRIRGEKQVEIVENDGGELYLKAGSISLEWSYSNDDQGWVYYNPDRVRVQIASADEFDAVELKRFAK